MIEFDEEYIKERYKGERKSKYRNNHKPKKRFTVASFSLIVTIVGTCFQILPWTIDKYYQIKADYEYRKYNEQPVTTPENIEYGNRTMSVNQKSYDHVPAIFYLDDADGVFDFYDPEKLENWLYTEIENYFEYLVSQEQSDGNVFDEGHIAKAKRLEDIVHNPGNLSTEEIEKNYDELINERVLICNNSVTYDAYISLAQDQKEYAAYLANTYASVRNGRWSDKSIRHSRASIENFLTAASFGNRRTSDSDILYYMAGDYDNIVIMSSTDLSTKLKAAFMANMLLKLSINRGGSHMADAYYNMGNEYIQIFNIYYHNEDLIGSENIAYFGEKAYDRLKKYEEIEHDIQLKRNACLRLKEICTSLYDYYTKVGNHQEAKKYKDELDLYTDKYE